jgi:hypothetical protein
MFWMLQDALKYFIMVLDTQWGFGMLWDATKCFKNSTYAFKENIE